MLFNSLEFPLFLAVVFACYWSLNRYPLRAQNLLVVISSYIFYGWWDWRFLGLIVLSSMVDYFAGLGLEQQQSHKRRRIILWLSLAVNLGALGVFKYFDFFIGSFADLLTGIGLQANLPSLRIILPVGISFYTFQTLSYTIDIYQRKINATRDWVAFFAFVSFFPQLVAGPIERASSLLPQFLEKRSFDPSQIRDGLRQILWGYLKKLVIADTMAVHVNKIFDSYQTSSGLVLLLGAFFFALQIYGDFSGYSDIAIGVARLFGFRLMQNFAFPYFSRDIGEFWRRWHISLSTWFRDYVYIPLGGSHCGRARRTFNIIVTFTVSGLWHGANWTFVVWGALNGLYYLPLMLLNQHKQHTSVVAEGKMLPSPHEISLVLLTFSLTLFAWVFFRAPSLGVALEYIARVFTDPFSGRSGCAQYVPLFALAIAFLLVEWMQRSRTHGLDIGHIKSKLLRWTIYLVVVQVIIFAGTFSGQEFIYFQF